MENRLLLADNGLLIRNELSGSIPKLPMQWYAGVDYGEVRTNSP